MSMDADPISGASPPPGRVVAVSLSATHSFSKPNVPVIRLLAGLGVAGDAHLGETVRHRSRVAVDPSQPNLRQVHLIAVELLGMLQAAAHAVAPGALGENVTTQGIDLLALPAGSRLQLGETAVVEVTGLRNPCAQIEHFQPGLLAQVLGRDGEGRLVRKAGIMGVVLAGGPVRAGDAISVTLPPLPHRKLERV